MRSVLGRSSGAAAAAAAREKGVFAHAFGKGVFAQATSWVVCSTPSYSIIFTQDVSQNGFLEQLPCCNRRRFYVDLLHRLVLNFG